MNIYLMPILHLHTGFLRENTQRILIISLSLILIENNYFPI